MTTNVTNESDSYNEFSEENFDLVSEGNCSPEQPAEETDPSLARIAELEAELNKQIEQTTHLPSPCPLSQGGKTKYLFSSIHN